MKEKIFISIILMSNVFALYATNQVERVAELEVISLIEPADDLTREFVMPTPLDVKKKYNITDIQLRQDIEMLTKKYNAQETNEQNRLSRIISVCWLGLYGTTNNLAYLKTIMDNPNDYAQEAAMESCIELLKMTPELIPLVRDVATNRVCYSVELKKRSYRILQGLSVPGLSPAYVSNMNVRVRIASYFLERAALEEDSSLYVDRVACDLNPTYRHSQQRRDNLARLRPTGLTGEQAEIYDARQRDALPKEGE
jgi:hypothetical protein